MKVTRGSEEIDDGSELLRDCSGDGWLVLKLSVGERESSARQEQVTEDVDRLSRWDRLDEQGSGNVRRLR